MIRFWGSGNLYGFLCLCFGLGPALRIFSKLLKVPISILMRLIIRIVICLDDMLFLGKTYNKVLRAKDTVIVLLQYLGFIINLEKPVYWYHINILKLLSIQASFVDFYKGKGSEVDTFSNRQHNSFKIPIENGGTKNKSSYI